MELNHFSHKHPLIFTEELENDGNKKVVCSAGCEEPVSGSGYKCSECNFLLHKSCAELSPEAQHPLHPDHPLTLVPASEGKMCNACRKAFSHCFFYRCDSCDFDLDIKCISRWRTDPDECHQHAFIPILKKINFPCEVCGGRADYCTDVYLCSICRLLTHGECTDRYSRSLKIREHSHLLTLTYSLQRVQGHSRIFCKLCYKRVGENAAVYYCKECNCAVDLKCAKAFEDRAPSANTESVPSKSELIEEINPAEDETAQPQEIKHFSHEHNLVFSDEEIKDGKFCDGCSLLIAAPFYHCEQCNFFLHKRCAKLPTVKKHLLHRHPLTLLSQSPFLGGIFRCDACYGFRNGFIYRCQECDYDLDLQCASVPETLEHKGHKHSLFLALNSSQLCNACEGSRSFRQGQLFVCTECEFAVCIKCSILPYEARHRYDNHLLTLTYSAEDDSGEYYCLICEEERDKSLWFYYCAECDFAAHPDCVLDKTAYIKFGRIHTSKYHQHPLTVVPKTKYSPPCDYCGFSFDDDMAIECSQCKLSIHYDC